jgi:beta-glucosidase
MDLYKRFCQTKGKLIYKLRMEKMKYAVVLIVNVFLFSLSFGQDEQGIYHDGWIDFNKNGRKDVYEDPSQDIEKRLDDLISQMTMEEKTCQMVTLYGYGRVLKDELPTPEWKNELWKDGIGNIDEQLSSTTFHPEAQTKYSYPHSRHAEAINTIQRWFVEETRLGIPVDFTNEGIRGLAHDRATCFPANIATGSTWDKNLVFNMGRIIGEEARILGYTNVYAPILDLARDPRWGRTVESYGEDPYLVAQIGMQMVKGIQENNVVSTCKHYAVYSVPKGGRDGDVRTDPHVAMREMHNVYLYPFKKAFKDAGAKGTMSSYNDYDGIPVSASHFFLTELLRNRFDFKGYVVSDSDAVEYVYRKHHVAEDYKGAIKQCVEAGLNIRTTFTPPEVYVNPLRELINEGRLSMDVVNERVRDVLRVKFWLGLFDKPYVEKPELAERIVHSDEHVKVAKQASHECLVLLKNEDNILPLDRTKLKTILVTGPNAKAIKHSMSRYGPNNTKVVSVFEGLKKKLSSNIEIKYAQGCLIKPDNWLDLELMYSPLEGQEKQMIEQAAEMAKSSDLAIVVLGDDPTTVGESFSRTSLNLPGYQEDLLKAVYEAGTPVVLVLINGRPATINWADKYVPAILEAWFPGEFGGDAVADALFGDYNPGGKLPVTFPKSVGQIPYNFPFKPSSQAGQGRHHSRVLEPLYPFGYGLSYTTFDYSDLQITPEKQTNRGNISVSCNVKNTGKLAGDEVVQLYFHDRVSSVTVYETQLRGFERIHLEPDQVKTVQFELQSEDISLLNRNMERVVEPGIFDVFIGSSSTDVRLKGSFEIKEKI